MSREQIGVALCCVPSEWCHLLLRFHNLAEVLRFSITYSIRESVHGLDVGQGSCGHLSAWDLCKSGICKLRQCSHCAYLFNHVAEDAEKIHLKSMLSNFMPRITQEVHVTQL